MEDLEFKKVKCAREYLTKIGSLNCEVKLLNRVALKLKSSYDSLGGSGFNLSGVRCSQMVNHNENKVVNYLDAISEIQDKATKIAELTSSIMNKVYNMADGIHRQVLIMRYIECKKLYDIARITHYTYRHIQRIHRDALIDFYDSNLAYDVV